MPRLKNVALFRALQLGDLLCAIPAIRAFRRAWPTTQITLIGLPWAADLVNRLDYIDDFIEFPGFPGLPERHPDSDALPGYIAACRARHFDLIVQMHGNGRLTNPLMRMLGAKRTAGFHPADESNPDPATFLPWSDDEPEVSQLLTLAAHLGAPACGEALELPVLPAEQEAFIALHASLHLEGQPYACIHPGARLATRRWLPERFAAVGDALAEAGLPVLLTGTTAEAALVADVRHRMRSPAANLAGRTTLGSLAALVGGAELVVCNDTGMSHVAAAMGTPSVVICSGADPTRWRPLDHRLHRVLWHAVPCRPCLHEICPTGHECAAGVEVDAVVAEVLTLLSISRETHHAAG